MSDPAPTTSEIVARHGIAWIGGGTRSEVYGCACGNRATGTEDEPFAAAHVRHVAELIEQASLAPIRAALDTHPTCDVHPDDDYPTCGWKRAIADVRRALDGDHTALLRDAWDEGHTAGYINSHEHRPGRRITNPYREGTP